MEEEPTSLEDAMNITEKKEKILNLMKDSKGKGSNLKEKTDNLNIRKQSENYSNYQNKYNSDYTQNNWDNNDANKFNNFNNNNKNKSYYNKNINNSNNNRVPCTNNFN